MKFIMKSPMNVIMEIQYRFNSAESAWLQIFTPKYFNHQGDDDVNNDFDGDDNDHHSRRFDPKSSHRPRDNETNVGEPESGSDGGGNGKFIVSLHGMPFSATTDGITDFLDGTSMERNWFANPVLWQKSSTN